MRCLLRNQQRFMWAQYLESQETTEPGGMYNGEHSTEYSEKHSAYGNVSPAGGSSTVAMFGEKLDYNKVIIMESLPAGFDELSLLWVDDLDADTPDYVVRRIAKSMNNVSIAIAKVSIG